MTAVEKYFPLLNAIAGIRIGTVFLFQISYIKRNLPIMAAPKAVVSSIDGLNTAIPRISACICIKRSF